MDKTDQMTAVQAADDQTVRDQAARDPVVAKQPAADKGLTTADLARGEAPAALFPAEDAKTFQARWDAVQVSFVDEPRRAVEQADALVAEALKRQAEIFAAARGDLEAQWARGQDVSTEDLRQALQRYRAFFTRVLKV